MIKGDSEMPAIVAWIVLAATAAGVAGLMTWLMGGAMRRLFHANAYMKPGQDFYVRAFAIVVTLGTLASVAGTSLPCTDQRKSMAAMEYAWWVVSCLEPAFWAAALFLVGYVVLLTILFAVLGRYRDQ